MKNGFQQDASKEAQEVIIILESNIPTHLPLIFVRNISSMFLKISWVLR